MIYILTEAKKGKTPLHLIRAISLYDAFSHKGREPLLVINGDSAISEFLNGRDCIFFNWIKEKQRFLDIIQYGDMGIIDTSPLSHVFYERFEKLIKIPVYIDDDGLDYPRGIVVKGSIFRESILSKGKDVTYLVGPEYVILDKEFWEVPEKKIRSSLEKIFIVLPAGSDEGVGSSVLNIITEEFSSISKIFIENIISYTKRQKESIFVLDRKRVKDEMLNTDLAISIDGEMIYELARVGIPTILIDTKERKDLKVWSDTGFALYIEKRDLEKLTLLIKDLLSYEKRKKMSNIGRSLIDGKGALRIAEALLSMR